jgi:hypothetical protein
MLNFCRAVFGCSEVSGLLIRRTRELFGASRIVGASEDEECVSAGLEGAVLQ